jgi:sialate O-acetylesterase
MKFRLLLLLALLSVIVPVSAAELRLAQPFQNHMVLQRQMPVPVWGWTDPSKTVTVKLGDQSATATSDGTGYWCAKLPAMEANSTGQTLTVTDGAKTITLNDVLVGEVWFCAGQSNMARPLKEEMIENPQAPKEFYTTDLDYPLVRFINYPNAASDTPLTDMDPVIDGKAAWQPFSATTSGDSMVMAFFFGRSLFKDLQVPVGLVQIAVSGTTQTAWAPKDVLDSVKADGARTFTYDDCFDAQEKALAAGKDPYKSWADWKTAEAAWRANPTGRWPGSLTILDYPGVLYNALVHPLAPMAFRGMIWHQGEAGPAPMYGARMVAMVNAWRKDYGQNFWFITGTMTRFTTKGPPLVPAAESLRSGVLWPRRPRHHGRHARSRQRRHPLAAQGRGWPASCSRRDGPHLRQAVGLHGAALGR